MMLAAEQPTAEEIDAFVIVNRKFLSDEAEETFRNMDGLDQKHVIAEGSLSNCKDPVAIIKSRARGGFLKAHIDWMHSHRDSSHEDVLDSYIEANVDWMTEEAEELLRSLSFNHLWKVIDFGSLQNCRDPAAIIRIRLKDVLRGKAGKSGKGKSSTGKGVQGRAVLHQAQTDGMDSLPSEDPAESSKGAQGGKAKGAKGAKGTKGAKDRPKDDIHEKALEEGRSLYCLGLPPLWSAKQIQDFFQHQGEVEGVYLQSMGKGKNTRGASVDFTTAEGARNAAMVCDRCCHLKPAQNRVFLRVACSSNESSGWKFTTKKRSLPLAAAFGTRGQLGRSLSSPLGARWTLSRHKPKHGASTSQRFRRTYLSSRSGKWQRSMERLRRYTCCHPTASALPASSLW
ncbi:unnamed protein product [Effrenium voratum]|nr:unnamed protein product [Effrenium voratum]